MTDSTTKGDIGMGWVIHCDCGTSIKGKNEDELVENAQEHAKNKHAVIVTREQALALAQQE
jgi:predicted small metal-binding protein